MGTPVTATIRVTNTGNSEKDFFADARLAKHAREFAEAQDLLYGAAQQSVLIVLQGMDTSGKDGTITHVMAPINPQGCSVTSFKQPTAEEMAHDFLWRIHQHTPEKGYIAVFNRSHYEDVLVVRVHDLIPKKVWKARYDAGSAAIQDLNQARYYRLNEEIELLRLKAKADEKGAKP